MCLFLPGAVEIVHQGGENPGGVVGAQQIHVAGHHLAGVVLHNGHDGFLEAAAIVPPPHEVQDGGAEGVVHDAVQLRIGEVPAAVVVGGFVGGILPHLAHEQRLRVDFPNPVVNHADKFVGQLIGYVQPEAVRAQLHPVSHHAVLVGDDVADEVGVHLVDGGKGVEIPPGMVMIRPLIEGIPVIVGGILAAVSTVAAEGTLAVEIETVGAGMGIHAVQDDLHAPGVGGIAHIPEVRLRAQHGVGNFIVAGVIAVVGEGLADGVEVDDARAQAGDIVHFLRDAPEIAAEEIVVMNNAVFIRCPVHVLVPMPVDGVGAELAGEIAFSAAVEAVGENLVDDGTLCPVRGGEVGADAADLPQAALLHIGVVPLLEQAEHTVRGVNLEIIEVQSRGEQGKISRVNVISAPLLDSVHFVIPGGAAVLVAQHNFHLPGGDRRGDVQVQCDGLPGGNAPKGGLKFRFFAVKQYSHFLSSF